MNPYENIFQRLVALAAKGELVDPKPGLLRKREKRLCKGGKIKIVKISPSDSEYVQKFVSLMKITSNPNDCWWWLGASRVRGYGSMFFKGKIWIASRLALLFSGRDPTGKCACHHCDNPNCVNPNHLFVGTMKENTLDMFRKGRATRAGENNSQCTTSEATVLAIRKEYVRGVVTQKQLAEKYNVIQTTISSIVLRKSWKHV